MFRFFFATLLPSFADQDLSPHFDVRFCLFEAGFYGNGAVDEVGLVKKDLPPRIFLERAPTEVA